MSLVSLLIVFAHSPCFSNSCFKNGMLPIVLAPAELEQLHADALAGHELTVDLERKVVVRPEGKGEISFQVDDFRRHCLINGLDDIGRESAAWLHVFDVALPLLTFDPLSVTLQHRDDIEQFETRRTATWPWLDGLGYAKKGGKVPVKPASPPKKKMDW